MRYAKDHKSETHARIVQTAGQRFREEGVDAVGVASMMASVGLTVGGFYAHFASKEALVAEACHDGYAETTIQLREYVMRHPEGERMAALMRAYLSTRHRDVPAQGCFVAAVGAEIARRPAETRAPFTTQVKRWISLIDETLKADGVKADARGIAGAMVGAMILARAVDDPALSESFLESGRLAVQGLIAKVKLKQ